jgi:hypothetical protein
MKISTAVIVLSLLGWITLPANSSAQIEATPLSKLEAHGVQTASVEYRGHAAVRLTESAPADSAPSNDAETLAIVPGLSLQDGTIEITLSGDTVPTAAPTARGFVGLAFRVVDPGHFECFYLRPSNGRAEDQLRRNHSAQYISVPGFPWEKLRSETPGKYESYVDLVPGEWTKIKIQVKGSTARLYVNQAEQPTLIVNDLKQMPVKGGVALWIGPGTVAHFRDLKVSP